MKTIRYLPIALGLLCQPLKAQTSWMVGGGFRSSPPTQFMAGTIGLNSVSDRDWTLGISRRWQQVKNGHSGILMSLRWRSPFYELDASLPYYPLKRHLPTYQVESVSLYPFVGVTGKLHVSKRLGWSFRLGPVFGFHSGNFISTTTARSIPGQSPFNLYHLYVKRHPMGIPYGRVQAEWTYLFLNRRHAGWSLHPFLQLDVGDRTQFRFVALPDDPVRRSEGVLRNGYASFGVLCEFVRKR